MRTVVWPPRTIWEGPKRGGGGSAAGCWCGGGSAQGQRSSGVTHPLAVTLLVHEELDLLGVRDAADAELLRGARGLAYDVAEVEDGGDDAALLDRHVLYVHQVGGAHAKLEGRRLEAVDDPLVGDHPDVVVIAVPVQQEADRPVEQPDQHHQPEEDPEIVEYVQRREQPRGREDRRQSEQDPDDRLGPEVPPVPTAHLDDPLALLEGEREPGVYGGRLAGHRFNREPLGRLPRRHGKHTTAGGLLLLRHREVKRS